MRSLGYITGKLGGLLLPVLLIAGCEVGPDYKTPEHPLPPQFAEPGTIGVPGGEVLTDWWTVFHDERLEALIKAAVEGNYSVAGAVARVNEARALRQETFYNLFPTVTAAGSYLKSRDSTARIPFAGDNIDLTHEVYRAGGDATWEIDLFGRVRREVEQSRAEERASISDLHDALRTVIAEVATNYLTLRGNQYSLKVAQQNADAQAQSVKLTEAQAQSGMISDLDVARSKAQLNGTLATIPPLQASVQLAIHRLAVLTGRNPEELLGDLSAPAALPKYEGPVALGDPAGLLRRRPDVRAAEERLAALTAGVGVAEGDLFPRVTFNGSLAYEASTPSRFGEAGTTSAVFGPSITWAAFDIGRVIAQVHAAGARAEGALAQYQQSVLTSLEEVENALALYSTELQRRNYLKKAAEESTRATGLAQDRYRAGSTDFLSVLVAQQFELNADVNLAQSETQLAINLVGLYKALGGGWEAAELTKREEVK